MQPACFSSGLHRSVGCNSSENWILKSVLCYTQILYISILVDNCG